MSGRWPGYHFTEGTMRYMLAAGLLAASAAAVYWAWFSQVVAERTGIPMNGKIQKSDEEWRSQLTPEQFRVARQKGTERAFTGAYWDCKDKGTYECACCGQ